MAKADGEIIDPLLKIAVTVQFVQPFQARKQYLCPGCNNDIAPGVGHIVAVPVEEPDLRRHWHKPCWTRALQHRA